MKYKIQDELYIYLAACLGKPVENKEVRKQLIKCRGDVFEYKGIKFKVERIINPQRTFTKILVRDIGERV
ncbi:MAG: hypothetical protein RSF36_04705 [Cetobacterium sp.]